jgi:epoxide hydrolase-like predicted phosphatase
MPPHGAVRLRALVVDYGGVLTSPLHDAMQAWCDEDEIDLGQFRAVMREWLGPSFGDEAVVNPAHALERGEISVPDFEERLAERLRTRAGGAVPAVGLLTRMFAGFRSEQPMVDVVRRTRAAGFKTALLSNSWGLDYDREDWHRLFDVTVVSGEVGMRKPEPRIYLHTASALGVAPTECVFVDDLGPNIKGAVSVGMVGVRHVTARQTVDELQALLGVDLSADVA